MNLLRMGLSGGALIIIIVVIRALLINHLPKKVFMLLWEIALLRLALPISIPSPVSIYPLTAKGAAMQEAYFSETALTAQKWEIIWCAGMVCCVLFFMIPYFRSLRTFRMSTPVSDKFITKWLETYRINRQIAVRQSDRIITPLTYGVFRPVILLPKWTDRKNEQQMQYILLHEYVHIRRFDTVRKLAAAFILCIYWWNPIVWIMYVLFNRDIELVCDECVVRKSGEEVRSYYAMTLIHMEESVSGLSPFCSGFCKNVVEERIIAIMRTQKITLCTFFLSCFLVFSMCGAFAVSTLDGRAENPWTFHTAGTGGRFTGTLGYRNPNKIYYIFHTRKDYQIFLSFDGGKNCYALCDETGQMSRITKLK